MQAPLLLPGLPQLRQPQQQHGVVSSQGGAQQREHQLQLLQQQEQRHRLLLQGVPPQQQQPQALQRSPQERRTQARQVQLSGQQDLLLPQHQMQHLQQQQPQNLQLQMPGTSPDLPKLAASTNPEHGSQYLSGAEQPLIAGSSHTAGNTALQQQQFSAGNSGTWSYLGAPIPNAPPLLQHHSRVSRQQLLQQHQPQLQQPVMKQQQQEMLRQYVDVRPQPKQEHPVRQQQDTQQKQKQQLSQQQINPEWSPVPPTGLTESTEQVLPQPQSQVNSGSTYDAHAAIQQQQQQLLNLQDQAGAEEILHNTSGHALKETKQQPQQQERPAATATQQLEERHEEAAARVTVPTVSDCNDAARGAQPTKQDEKKISVCKGSQRAAARITATGCSTNASQKTSCFEILYQDALHRRTRQLRAELGRDRAARSGNRQTCTPQQWEQRWNLMIKRHQEKISFNEALKRKLEVSKREDEGRECTFKPVTWSLRKPLVQQKRRLLKLEALAEQQQVLKEALFVLQYEEKQMDEYIAIKLQEEVGRASTEEKSDEELKNILDFYRDRKTEETNRHRSMKLDLLTQLTRLDQQYKRTAASGNLQDTEAAEAVGFDLSLSDKIREDIMEELDSVNSLRCGAKFRAIWKASLPMYGNCYDVEHLQSDGSSEFTIGEGGCSTLLPTEGAAGSGAAGQNPGDRMSLAQRRSHRGDCSDRQALKSPSHRSRRHSSSSSGPSRSTVTGRPLSRNTLSSPSSSSGSSKSRRGSIYNAATARDQHAIRRTHYSASPPISPRADSHWEEACMTQPLCGTLSAQGEGQENAVQAQLWMQREDSLLHLQQQNATQEQQQVDLAQHKRGLEEGHQQRGMQQGFAAPEGCEGNFEEQKAFTAVSNIAVPSNYGGRFTADGPVSGGSNPAGYSLQRAAIARENSFQTLSSTGVRHSVQQQRGWQPHQVSVNGSPQVYATDVQAQPEPSLHMAAATTAEAPQSQLRGQQSRSGATHMAASLADIRDSGFFYKETGGQQAVASSRDPAFSAGQQPTRVHQFQVNEKSLQKIPAQEQQPFLPVLQQQQACGSLYTTSHGYPQLQQVQTRRQQDLLSQQYPWQGSVPAASKTSPQQTSCQMTGSVAATQQPVAYSSQIPVLPAGIPPSMQTLHAPPVQANGPQDCSSRDTGRYVSPAQHPQQQQTGQHEHLRIYPQAAQQHQGCFTQPHISQKPAVPSGAPVGGPHVHSVSVMHASRTLSPSVTGSQPTHTPQTEQAPAFASSQLRNQAQRILSGSVAPRGRAGAQRADGQPEEGWVPSLLALQGRSPAAISHLQQPKKAEKTFVLPPTAATLQPRNNTLLKGGALMHLPPFPSAGAGLVDFAAAAKLCQRGNMLFAAR